MHPHPRELFEHRLRSLERFVHEPTVLAAYDAAATLRQLLLDATPLVDVVKREVRVRVTFEVNTLPDSVTASLADVQGLLFAGLGMSPRATESLAPTRRLTLAQFLKEPVVLTAWKRVTVRELILWAAQESGGVHYDPKPDSETSILLRSLIAAIESERRPILGNTILAIARVVLDGLEPLRVAAADPARLE